VGGMLGKTYDSQVCSAARALELGVLVRNVSPAAKLAPLPAAGGVHPPRSAA
jgi:hypothetical protein